MTSEQNRTKKELQDQLEDARRRIAELETDLARRTAAEEALKEREARHEEAQAVSHVGHWDLDLVNNVLNWSDEVYRIFGLKSQQFAATLEAFLASVHPEDRERVTTAYSDSLKDRIEYTIEHRVVRPGGEVRVVFEHCTTHYDQAGKPVRSLGTVQDITERARMEEALGQAREELENRIVERTASLRESERRFRAIADYTYDWEGWHNSDGRLRWVNPAVERFTGCTVEEALDMPEFPLPLVVPEDRKKVRGHYREATAGSSGNDKEFRLIRKDGAVIFAAISWQPIHDEEGRSLGFRTSVRDVTERQKAQEALRESEKKFRTILESIHIGIVILDAENHTVTDLNPYAADLIGLPREQVVGRECHKFICPNDCGDCPVTDRGLKVDNAEGELLVAGGRSVTVLKTVVPTTINGREHLLESIIDITERKRTENELRKLNRAVEQANAAILVTDTEARIEFVNPAFTRLTGFTAGEALGENPRLLKSGFHSPEFFKEMWNTLTKGDTWSGEILNKKKNNETFWQYVSIAPINN